MVRDGLSLHTSTHLPSGTAITPCTFPPLSFSYSPLLPKKQWTSNTKNGGGWEFIWMASSGEKNGSSEIEQELAGDKCKAEKCEEDAY